MPEESITEMDLVIETHVGLERQGPGSDDVTLRALSFVEGVGAGSRVLDLGCGTGGPTTLLARQTGASVTGVDLIPEFIEALNARARELGLSDRLGGVVSSMDDLAFEPEGFDLVWSEGAVDAIGFARGVSHWRGFLKPGGHVAVSCPSWLGEERPEEVARLWQEAGSSLDPVADNVATLEAAGFSFVAAFALPEECWTRHYFEPRTAAEAELARRHPESELVRAYLEGSRREMDLYARHGQRYGYVFYIGRRL